MTITELLEAGITYYTLQKLIESNQVERLKRGLYRWQSYNGDEWAEINKLVPSGCLCLYSAASLNELSNFVSSAYHVAIPKKSKITLPAYPPIKLYYWEKQQLSCGKIELDRQGSGLLPIYDREKTVCDFVKFRNKVGLDLMKEVIKSYLSRSDRDISKLLEYGKILKISTVLHPYIDLLV